MSADDTVVLTMKGWLADKILRHTELPWEVLNPLTDDLEQFINGKIEEARSEILDQSWTIN